MTSALPTISTETLSTGVACDVDAGGPVEAKKKSRIAKAEKPGWEPAPEDLLYPDPDPRKLTDLTQGYNYIEQRVKMGDFPDDGRGSGASAVSVLKHLWYWTARRQDTVQQQWPRDTGHRLRQQVVLRRDRVMHCPELRDREARRPMAPQGRLDRDRGRRVHVGLEDQQLHPRPHGPGRTRVPGDRPQGPAGCPGSPGWDHHDPRAALSAAQEWSWGPDRCGPGDNTGWVLGTRRYKGFYRGFLQGRQRRCRRNSPNPGGPCGAGQGVVYVVRTWKSGKRHFKLKSQAAGWVSRGTYSDLEVTITRAQDALMWRTFPKDSSDKEWAQAGRIDFLLNAADEPAAMRPAPAEQQPAPVADAPQEEPRATGPTIKEIQDRLQRERLQERAEAVAADRLLKEERDRLYSEYVEVVHGGVRSRTSSDLVWDSGDTNAAHIECMTGELARVRAAGTEN